MSKTMSAMSQQGYALNARQRSVTYHPHPVPRPPEPAHPRRSLNAERAAGEARVAEERAAVEAKLERVRGALAERYEAGFKPLLAEAEARHAEELRRIVELQVR